MNTDELLLFSMIVFIDDKYFERLNSHIPPYLPIKLIPINIEYLKQNIKGWTYLEKEREIMKSDYYKNMVRHRISYFPENSYAEYTTLTNCKVDFVCKGMDITDADYYCWVDFGYFKLQENIPRRPIDINKLDLNKVNIQLLEELSNQDENVIYTMRNAPERVAGAFVFASKEKYKEYQELHHLIQQEFHEIGLVDDDQHITLRCYYRQPELFTLHVHYWSMSLVLFQKD